MSEKPTYEELEQRIRELEQHESEHKQDSKDLQASQRMLQAVLDTIPSAVFWKDYNSNYLGANRTWLEAVGMKLAAEVVGKSDYDLPWEQEQAESFRKDDRNVMESGLAKHNIIEPYRKFDGTRAWARTNKVPLRDEEGNVTGILGTYEDITEYKQAEEKLKESEQKFKSIFNNASVGIALADTETRQFYMCNQRFCDLFGYDPKEMLTLGVENIHPPEALPWVLAEFASQAKAEKSLAENIPCLKKDGTVFYADVNTAPMDIGGRKYNIGFFTDSTERKQMQEALWESEEKFRELFERMPSGVAVYTAVDDGKDFIFKDFNHAAEKIEKIDREKIIGKAVTEAFPGVKEFGVFDVFQKVWKSGEPQFLPAALYKDERDPGSWRESWVYKLASGDIVSVYNDVTERKQTEEEFAQVFKMSLDLICIADINTNTFLKINPAFTATLGYSEDELLDRPFTDFIHPDDIDATLDTTQRQLIEGAKIVNFENRYRRKDGTYRWLSWVAHPIQKKGITYAVARDITESKVAERAIRESKELLDATGRMAKIGGWELDANSLEVTWTDETYRIHEVPLDYVPQLEEAINFFHPEERERLSQAVQRAIDDGEPYDMALRFLTAKGTPLYTRTLCRPEVSEGKTVKLKGIFHDITDQKKVELALRESEEKYRSMMESMKAAVYICSSDFKVEYMNPQMIKRTGRDATGEFCYQMLHGHDKQCPWCVHDKVMQGQSVSQEVLSPKDHRHYDVSHSPIFHQNGSISKMTIYRDITEQKKFEEERARLSTAIEQASESIIISDGPGTIQYVNPAFEELSGYSREEIVGQNFRTLKSDRHDEDFYRQMYAKISQGEIWAGRIANQMRDGTLREFETRISPIKDASGRIINYVSVNRDITQEITLEAMLQQTQRLQSIGTLAGGIAHDFNNLLAVIIANTELTLKQLPELSPVRESLSEIRTASLRAKEAIRQILSYSRYSKAKPKPVKAADIVQESLALLRASIPSNIEIQANIVCKSDTIRADASQINQVVMNLCTNAYQAMNTKGGTLHVELIDIAIDDARAKAPVEQAVDRYLRLTVQDTGAGITPEVMDRIFDPYFTTKEVGEGSGLGLWVVHGIVKNCGGWVEVDSAPGQGTTVSVFLPLTTEEAATADAKTEDFAAGDERILLVDDEESVIRAYTLMLTSLGYEIVASTQPDEALVIFETHPRSFDLVITDMIMPKMSGDKLAEKLKAIRPDIPVIICSGYSELLSEDEAERIGVRAFCMKPVVEKDLVQTIRQVLDEV